MVVGSCNHPTTRLPDYMTIRLLDYLTTRLLDYLTTRLLDYLFVILNLLLARTWILLPGNVPKKTIVVPLAFTSTL